MKDEILVARRTTDKNARRRMRLFWPGIIGTRHIQDVAGFATRSPTVVAVGPGATSGPVRLSDHTRQPGQRAPLPTLEGGAICILHDGFVGKRLQNSPLPDGEGEGRRPAQDVRPAPAERGLLRLTQHNFRVMQVILQHFIKPAHVYSVHDGMMPLHAQRHLQCVVLLEVFSPRKAGYRIRWV